MKGAPTRHSNVYRMDDGRLFVMVTARVAGKKIYKRQVLLKGATEADALRLVAELKDQLAGLELPQAPATRAIPTLGVYCEQWLRVKGTRLREGVGKECNIIGSMICVSWAEIACYRSGRVRFCWSEWWGMIVFCAINKIYQFQT